jgi:hypothetical protein
MGTRPFLKSLIGGGLFLVAACAPDLPEVDAETSAFRAAPVAIVRSAALPIEEASGLGLTGRGRAARGLVIGDRDHAIVTFSLEASGPLRFERHDIRGAFAEQASQWEAVAGDASGRAFVLGEKQSKIWVVDASLREVTQTIDLVVPGGHPLAADWADDDNSRGEGLVLLANGHVLVAKEKKPPSLVEFAPRGETAEGFHSGLALGSRSFPLPPGRTTLEATKHWKLDGGDADQMGDISDLAVDAGELLLLSDQGRRIARVTGRLSPNEREVKVARSTKLPRRIDKPEGLVVVDGHPLVVTDGDDPRAEAFFELSALP